MLIKDKILNKKINNSLIGCQAQCDPNFFLF